MALNTSEEELKRKQAIDTLVSYIEISGLLVCIQNAGMSSIEIASNGQVKFNFLDESK